MGARGACATAAAKRQERHGAAGGARDGVRLGCVGERGSWVRCWVVCLGFRVGSYSFICNLSDVARVGIGGSVGDNLGTTIGKSDTV